jgi:hypothetical protein
MCVRVCVWLNVLHSGVSWQVWCIVAGERHGTRRWG